MKIVQVGAITVIVNSILQVNTQLTMEKISPMQQHQLKSQKIVVTY